VSDDWQSRTIESVRSLILVAEPETVEEAKWRKASTPTVSRPSRVPA